MKPKLAAEEIASIKLAHICPIHLHLAWHENRSSFFSSRKERGSLYLRLHRLFSKAPSPVLEAVVSYAVKGDPKDGAIVRQMAHLYFSMQQIEPDPLETKGKVYDLEEIQKRIQEQYFSKVKAAIGWSPRQRFGHFKCMTFGSYDRQRNQIRVNPLLDDEAVPLYFVEFIVYHEMLHAVCPAKMDAKGAIRSHTREFRMREKQFADYEKAKEWEKTSLKFFKTRKRHGRS